MITISQELKNEFNNQDVSMFTHKVYFYDYTTETETIVEENISDVKESIGIDGMPIGKFPIGVLTFKLGGDYTKRFRVNGNYYVWIGDTYILNQGTENEVEESIGSKVYFINKAEYDKKTNKTSFECYDSANKLNVKYEGIPSVTYPCTFGEFVLEFYLNYGFSVNMTGLINDDFIIESELAFDDGISALQVAREIGKFALSVQFLDNNDTIQIIPASRLSTSNITSEEFLNLKEFSIESDYFKTQGINTLVLGLSSEIDGENVSKLDESMVGNDGTVELRLDNIPFVWNEILKRQVINNMFEEIKGFKYKSFNLVGKQFYYEIGDIVHQTGLGDNEESFNLLVLDKEVVHNGSMITTYGASSQSSSETEYKWSEFTSRKKTEILVDKANQQILIANKTIDEHGVKFSEIENTIEGIRMEVSQLGGYNIIPNIIGEFGVNGWSFVSEPFNFRSSTPYAVFNALPIYFINNNGSIMYSVNTTTSSKFGFRFWKDGVALSEYAIVEGGSKYSLYTRVKGTGILRFKIREYTSLNPSNKDSYHKETLLVTSIVNNNYTTLQGSLDLESNTGSVVLVVESDVDVYTQQFADFTDTSFNIGNPKPYGESLTAMNDKLLFMETQLEQTAEKVTISSNKVTEVEGKVIRQQSQLNIQANEISSKVSKNGIVSSINQTAETIKIDASKLNLNGYVTVSSLSGNGTTTIDGSNIKTGTISATRLDLSGVLTVGDYNESISDYTKKTDLSTTGRTVINGANITTGKISADRINFNNAVGSNMTLSGKFTIGSITLESAIMNFWGTNLNTVKFTGSGGSYDPLYLVQSSIGAGFVNLASIQGQSGNLRIQGAMTVADTINTPRIRITDRFGLRLPDSTGAMWRIYIGTDGVLYTVKGE